VSFAKTAGEYGPKGNRKVRGPRLYVQCVLPSQPGCSGRQSVACERNWRMLLPVWRTHPVYLALRQSHERYERVHNLWRVRWRVAAADHSLRPKRRGVDCQQLRANAALVCEWLVICHREGWLPGQRAVTDSNRISVDDGTDRALALLDYREQEGLEGSYGTVAVRLGTGKMKPTKGSGTKKAQDPTEPPDTPEPVITDADPPSALPPKSAAEIDDVDGFPW
jgi:hypothetical protein